MKLVRLVRGCYKLLTGKKKIKFSIIDSNRPAFDINRNYTLKERKSFDSKIVSIDGIGWSGSSAVTDFLGEFKSCLVLGGVDLNENPERGIDNSFECDFFRNAHSIFDLERICSNRVVRIGNQAILDFLETVEDNYAYGPKLLFRNDNYLFYTQKFLREIIDFETILDGKRRYIVKKISKDIYRGVAREYLHNILSALPNAPITVFDNLISMGDPDESIVQDYFDEDAKVIFVWRDPRDIYASARLAGSAGNWVPSNPVDFVKWYTFCFPDYLQYESNNLLMVRFEDFVTEYERVSSEIMNFVGLSVENQINKFSYFNPNVSKNNVGIYKNITDKQQLSALKFISEALSEYCFGENM